MSSATATKYRPTIGPWTFAPRGSEHVQHVTAPDGKTVAQVWDYPEAEANATVIASAPELLHALRQAVEVVDLAGLIHLSNGVQLGATSWYVKASDRFDYARDLLKRIDEALADPEASTE